MRKWGGGSAQCCVTVSSSLHQIFDFYPYSLWIGGGDTFFVLLKPFPFRVQGHGLPCRGKYNVYPTPSLNIFFFSYSGPWAQLLYDAWSWVLSMSLTLGFALPALTCVSCGRLNSSGICETAETSCEATNNRKCALRLLYKGIQDLGGFRVFFLTCERYNNLWSLAKMLSVGECVAV